MVQVIVTVLDVLLKIETASPAEKVALGIVMEPPDPTWTNLPMSEVVKE
jgi:hypothetical protein